MIKRGIITLALAAALTTGTAVSALADTTNSLLLENCGAYLFEWRPQDCGDGRAFAIIAGGNTLYEHNVILNRGYDYAYNVEPANYTKPWGALPALKNVDGVWAIPENWSSLPEGTQPTMEIVLKSAYKTAGSNLRYIDVVYLPGGIQGGDLPAEVRRYIINADGSDSGAYIGTVTSGWEMDESGEKWMYRKYDGTFVKDTYLTLGDKTYYMDANGYMLEDTYAPDGTYINPKGEKVSYKPGWDDSSEKGRRYIQKNGYYAASRWIEDNGKWYYFNMANYMETNDTTPDGYYVGADGAWDGVSSVKADTKNVGPGIYEGWVEANGGWKYQLLDGSYLTDSWKEDKGKWYYLDENGMMLVNAVTPEGYVVDANGVWDGKTPAEKSSDTQMSESETEKNTEAETEGSKAE